MEHIDGGCPVCGGPEARYQIPYQGCMRYVCNRCYHLIDGQFEDKFLERCKDYVNRKKKPDEPSDKLRRGDD